MVRKLDVGWNVGWSFAMLSPAAEMSMAANKLTAIGVKRLVKPGRYGDGGGLWLQVRDAERRSWIFR